MRMWMVDPKHMCRKHLLGEHVELHMFLGAMQRGTSMSGFLENNLLEPLSLYSRHDDLVREMQIRGYRHDSPMTKTMVSNSVGLLSNAAKVTRIDRQAAATELFDRCPECRARKAKA